MKRVDMTSYEFACENFEWQVPAQFNYGGDVVDAWADDPDRLALIWVNGEGRERRFTFAEIRDLTNRFANYLTEKGIGKGDRVQIGRAHV